ncbi:MAG TPA: SRPBCC family protein [Planctomycetota bacterium]|nr:SRPBCC family protein [Planctomycetota bacterium]
MKIALVVVASLVLLGALIVVVGACLPRAHRASRSATYRKPPETIYAAITDFASMPQWLAEVKRVEMLEPANGLPVYRTHGSWGAVTYRVEVMERPRRLVGRIADVNLGYGGSWTYDVESVPQGAHLTITEDGEISNPLFRFLARFVFGYHGAMDGYLKGLGRKLGEDVLPA